MSLGRLWRRLVDVARRRRWLVSAAWAVVPMLAGWWWWAGSGPDDVAAARALPPADAPQASPSGPPSEVRSRMAAAVAPMQPQSLPRVVAHWDLCGVGRMPVPAGGFAAPADGLQALPAHLGSEPAAAAAQRALLTLYAGAERSRAAALLLLTAARDDTASRAELLALAATTRDPVVAMWATQRCNPSRGCDGAWFDRWVELEPDNAAAWLALMEVCPARRAEAAAAVLQTRRFDLHQHILLAEWLSALPADVPPYLLPAVWDFAVGIDAALPIRQTQQASLLCPAAAASSAQPPPHCNHLAQVMTTTSDTLMGYTAGIAMARRAGWSAERLQALRAATPDLTRVLLRVDDPQPLSCASVDRLRRVVEGRARRGELAMLRDLSAAASAASGPAR